MRDPMTFEDRLTGAFAAYTAAAPLDVDPRALVAELAGGGRSRRLALPTFNFARFGGVRLALVLGLLALASVVGLLFAGGFLRPDGGPLGGGGRILVTGPARPGTMLDIVDSGVRAREVPLSGCPQVIGNADAVATNARFVGILFTAFDGSSSSPIKTNYGGGERWSPDNRVLALLDATHGAVTFVTLANGDVLHPVKRTVPLGLDIEPDTDGNRLFEGTFSRDGRHLLVESAAPQGDPPARQLTLLDVEGGAPRRLAVLPTEDPRAGVFLRPMWSADGSAVALVTTHDGVPQLATISTSNGEIQWLGRPDDVAPEAELVVADVAPDGSRVAVLAGGLLEIVETTERIWHRTPLAWPLEPTASGFAPDGRQLALVNGKTLTTLDIATNTVRRRSLPSALVAWSPDRTVLAVLDPGTAAGQAAVSAWDPWSDAPPSMIASVRTDQAGANPIAAQTRGRCLLWLPEVGQ
jgi:hypothetical protein